jgi:flagellar hook-length control protein FliK
MGQAASFFFQIQGKSDVGFLSSQGQSSRVGSDIPLFQAVLDHSIVSQQDGGRGLLPLQSVPGSLEELKEKFDGKIQVFVLPKGSVSVNDDGRLHISKKIVEAIQKGEFPNGDTTMNLLLDHTESVSVTPPKSGTMRDFLGFLKQIAVEGEGSQDIGHASLRMTSGPLPSHEDSDLPPLSDEKIQELSTLFQKIGDTHDIKEFMQTLQQLHHADAMTEDGENVMDSLRTISEALNIDLPVLVNALRGREALVSGDAPIDEVQSQPMRFSAQSGGHSAPVIAVNSMHHQENSTPEIRSDKGGMQIQPLEKGPVQTEIQEPRQTKEGSHNSALDETRLKSPATSLASPDADGGNKQEPHGHAVSSTNRISTQTDEEKRALKTLDDLRAIVKTLGSHGKLDVFVQSLSAESGKANDEGKHTHVARKIIELEATLKRTTEIQKGDTSKAEAIEKSPALTNPPAQILSGDKPVYAFVLLSETTSANPGMEKVNQGHPLPVYRDFRGLPDMENAATKAAAGAESLEKASTTDKKAPSLTKEAILHNRDVIVEKAVASEKNASVRDDNIRQETEKQNTHRARPEGHESGIENKKSHNLAANDTHNHIKSKTTLEKSDSIGIAASKPVASQSRDAVASKASDVPANSEPKVMRDVYATKQEALENPKEFARPVASQSRDAVASKARDVPANSESKVRDAVVNKQEKADVPEENKATKAEKNAVQFSAYEKGAVSVRMKTPSVSQPVQEGTVKGSTQERPDALFASERILRPSVQASKIVSLDQQPVEITVKNTREARNASIKLESVSTRSDAPQKKAGQIELINTEQKRWESVFAQSEKSGQSEIGKTESLDLPRSKRYVVYRAHDDDLPRSAVGKRERVVLVSQFNDSHSVKPSRVLPESMPRAQVEPEAVLPAMMGKPTTNAEIAKEEQKAQNNKQELKMLFGDKPGSATDQKQQAKNNNENAESGMKEAPFVRRPAVDTLAQPTEPGRGFEPAVTEAIQSSTEVKAQPAVAGAQAPIQTAASTEPVALSRTESTSSAQDYVDKIAKLQASVSQQMVHSVKGSLGSERSFISLRLDPQSLGSVAIHLKMENGKLSVQLMAQKESTRLLLEKSIASLKSAFDESGIKAERIVVSRESAEVKQAENGKNEHPRFGRSKGEQANLSHQENQKRRQRQGNDWKERLSAQDYFL